MATAKLFKTGRSQAVRLPKEFRFKGKEVRIRRVGQGVLLEPMKTDWQAIFDEMDRLCGDLIQPSLRGAKRRSNPGTDWIASLRSQ